MNILISGGCGFIGTNLALYHLKKGDHVISIDDMSRSGSYGNMAVKGVYTNLEILNREKNFTNFEDDISRVFEHDMIQPDIIYHLAAQVGVQKSIDDPKDDFNRNIVGTFNLLEYARHCKKLPIFIYASTNKVYGELRVNKPVDENTPLDFHTPYGCSKGSADQYVLDYARIYHLPSIVFRQSCIYGYYQNGTEDQGWVAWFLIANMQKLPITIYGDGTQVRDILWVEDLINCYQKAIKKIEVTKGQAYNIGGGDKNVISLQDLIQIAKIDTETKYTGWRPADQKYYVSNIQKAKRDFGWEPSTNSESGILKLQSWFKNA